MTQNGRISYDDLDGGLGQGCGPNIILYFIVAVILMTLCGCRSIQYVPVVENHTDTVLITKLQRDSVWQHDSVHVHEYAKGDTVYMELTRWHTKYVETLRTDTMYEHRTDSVPVPYEVPARLTAYQQLKQDYGGWAFLLVILTFIYIIRKFARKILP